MRKRKGEKNRLGKWSHEHRHDRKYRKAQAEGSRRHIAELHRDARLGRAARAILANIKELVTALEEAGDLQD